jgi:hypothetical protein
VKYRLSIFVLCIFAVLLAACGGQADQTDVAVAVALTQTAAAPAATQAPTTGFISGRVHLVAPPTPPMIVYAVDQATGLWASVETAAADGEADYTIEVQPGNYVLFAFSLDENTPGYTGHANAEGTDLGAVSVVGGQTVSDIMLTPPGQAACGSMWGIPPSPDGRFASINVSKECLVTQAAGSGYVPVSDSVCQMLQEMASQSVALPFDMQLSAPFTNPISGETGFGCTLTANNTHDQTFDQAVLMSLLLDGFAGWEEQAAYQADGPTGAATALTRDMALMLVSVNWTPAPGIECPADQPISACNLKPEQKSYTIQIQVAQK